MYINKIEIKNFRNYEKQEIELNPHINIFYGDNAQGKTNILEAIFISGFGKSFRTSKEKEGDNAHGLSLLHERFCNRSRKRTKY